MKFLQLPIVSPGHHQFLQIKSIEFQHLCLPANSTTTDRFFAIRGGCIQVLLVWQPIYTFELQSLYSPGFCVNVGVENAHQC
jgi:hypothetical protein